MCRDQLASLDVGESVIGKWFERKQIYFHLAEDRRELQPLKGWRIP
jgi:hypothetical protein